MSASRLHRLVPVKNSSLFAFYSPPFALYDNQIHSIKIHRGSDSRGGGSFPSIMELTTTGAISNAVNGHLCRVFLRDAVASGLSTLTGAAAESLTMRFTGRLGQVDVEDIGAGKFRSTVTASSWITQMSYSSRSNRPVAGQLISRVFNDQLGLLDGSAVRGITGKTFGSFDRVAISETEGLAWDDFVAKYLNDLGYLARETRDGTTQLMGLPYRVDQATFAAANKLPITRSNAVSPARWEQHNERPPADHQFTYTDPAGGLKADIASLTAGDTGEIKQTIKLDWSYITADTEQTNMEAYGRTYERSPRQFRVPSITVDILSLLRSTEPYYLRLAGQLLTLEAGDPLPLSGDWPATIQGMYFATGITETITPDAWTLELSLETHSRVTGRGSPPVRAYTWDQLNGTWNAKSGTWAGHALPA